MKKNILLKFKDFMSKCDEGEKKELYDVLTALRGPDKGDHEEVTNIKRVFTCKIREVLGFHPVLTVRAFKPRKDVERLSIGLEKTGWHWENHVMNALRHLELGGLMPTGYLKFMERLRKKWADRWEIENKNRKVAQVSGKQ